MSDRAGEGARSAWLSRLRRFLTLLVERILLAAGLDPNETGSEFFDARGEHTPFWPLFDAALANSEPKVKLLLEYGADPLQVLPRNGQTLIQMCARMISK